MTTKQLIASFETKATEILAEIKKISSKLDKPTSQPAPAPQPTPATELYIPETQASRFAQANPNYPGVDLIKKIAAQPTAEWLGEWSGNVFNAVKSYQDKAGNKLPVYVAYNIPGRDNDNYSAGGLHSPAEYYSWIGSIGASIGDRKAWIDLEPDAIGLSIAKHEVINPDGSKSYVDALTDQQKQERYTMLSIAIDILRKQPNLKVYLDASMWHSPEKNAELLRRAGIDKADGFSVNVSGFKKTDECISYANKLSALLSGKHFVIDTSRNGNGEWITTEKDPWCNPPGRALGETPKLNPVASCDGYLWIKRPGESDGSLRGAPAGTFMPDYAIELARNAGW
jgi:endoglucanase